MKKDGIGVCGGGLPLALVWVVSSFAACASPDSVGDSRSGDGGPDGGVQSASGGSGGRGGGASGGAGLREGTGGSEADLGSEEDDLDGSRRDSSSWGSDASNGLSGQADAGELADAGSFASFDAQFPHRGHSGFGDGAVAVVGSDAADGAGDADPLSREAICSGGGEVVKVVDTRADTPDTVCTGSLARRLFDHAICTCESVAFGGYLHTSSFHSYNEPLVVSSGAPVGINTDFVAASYTDVGGSLQVAGSSAFGGFLEVGGDLKLAGDMILAGLLAVGRDAWIAGDTLVTEAFVERDYIYTPATTAPLPLWSIIGGQRREQDFSVPEPCECAPDELLDVDAVIEDGRTNNHNDEVNLAPTQFEDLIGVNTFTLPCGRYYVDEISGLGSLTLRVEGRTALFVRGDVSIAGIFDVQLGPSGQLDLFIGGNLLQIGAASFGDPNRPADLRVFVGGSGDIAVVGIEPFNANLYAPRSDLLSGGAIFVRGSVFVNNMTSGSWTDVIYDRAVLDQGDEPECAPPPPPVTDGGSSEPDSAAPPPPECTDACSGQCQAGQTCVAETCTGCSSDADCCAPLVCDSEGKCAPLLL